MKALIAAFAAASCLAACSDPAQPPPPPPGEPVASLQLDRDTAIVQMGQTVQLNATLRDAAGRELNRLVAWATLHPGIASVTEGGLVTAKGVGSGRIVASAEGKSDTAVIRVPGPVASVTIDIDTARLAEGAQRQMGATARDAQGIVVTGRAVIWSSVDPDVASVGDLGLVTAIRPGMAEVRARVDGDTGRAIVVVSADHAYDLVFAGWTGTAGEPNYLYQLDINQAVHPATKLSSVLATGDFAVSPDGSQYVVTGEMNGVRGIYIVNRDGSNPTLVRNDPDASQPAWSPDGEKIAFRRWPIGSGADILIMNVDGSDVVNLTADHGATSQHTPTFSPSREGGSYRIAYSHSPGPTAHIWTMNADGSDKQQLTTGEEWDDWPSWSPDGATIAFQRVATDIWVVPASGGTATRFVGLPSTQLAPKWSPDGALLAFASKHASANYEIFTVRADGSGLARRTHDALDKQEPAWVVK